MKTYLTILFFSAFVCFNMQAQKDSIKVKTVEKELKLDNNGVYNPLSPAKAAFLSAVIPGAGQIYNNRYWWQLPLIYGGLGVSVYSFVTQNNNYNEFREASRLRAAGLEDQFTVDGVQLRSDEFLQSAQENALYNRNISLLFVILTYVLQITEASVRAHLLQFNTTEDLSIVPTALPDYDFKEAPKVGLTIKYTF